MVFLGSSFGGRGPDRAAAAQLAARDAATGGDGWLGADVAPSCRVATHASGGNASALPSTLCPAGYPLCAAMGGSGAARASGLIDSFVHTSFADHV